MKSPLFFSVHIQLLIDRKLGPLKIHVPISKSLHRLHDEFGLEPKDLDCVSIHSVDCVTEWLPGISKLVP